MAVIYEIKERRVVPNWRDYKRTLQLGELSQSNKSAEPLVLSIDRSVEDWKEIKNIGTAADLVNSAFCFRHSTIRSKGAIDFINPIKERLHLAFWD